ncbi:TonB-dependent receptor domain-containing protein [Thermovibrio sp.]
MRKLLTVTLLFTASTAYGEDLLITANRVPVPQEAITEDAAVITKEEIKKFGLTSVADVLKYASGITVSSNGGFGQPTNLFMLGLPGKHILVMVNGVPVYDPSTPSGTANFNWIDLSNIERIEVVKGPQGALYGSDAIAGVINIITKKPKEREFKATLLGGKYKTFKERVYGGLPLENGYLSFTFENFKTNGFNATTKENTLLYEPDNDGFRYKTGWFSYGWQPTDRVRITGDLKVKQGSVDYDAGKYFPNAKSDYENFFTDLKVDTFITDKFSITATFGHNGEYRSYSYGRYAGVLRSVSLQPIYYLSDNLFITGGFNYRQEKADFSTKASAHLRSAFLELHGQYKDAIGTVAVRRDSHSQFGCKTTYKVSAGYLIKELGTKLRAQYGTGFRAPSLYELYSYYGNPGLRAETSEGWNFGVDQKLPFFNGSFSITYFKNRVWNLIDMPWWQGVYKYENYNKAITEGAEVKAAVKVCKEVELFGNYTHLRAKDFNPSKKTWEKLPRRPKFSYTLGFNSKLGKVKFSAWALHYSDREDSSGKTLGGFTTYNCYASYSLKENFNLFAKAYNLTNKKYQLAYGYNTLGRSLFVGATYAFK